MSLQISADESGLTIAPTASGPWRLTLLESGRLRGTIRDALLSLDRPPGCGGHELPGGRGWTPDSVPPTGRPARVPRRVAVSVRSAPDVRMPDVAASEVLPTVA